VLLEPTPEVREGNMALVVDPTGAVLALQKSTS
jgi:predicted enzyme related to lactoylglutathione lyase